MCERRVLIAAVVTDIHDSTVAYPSCIGCYSKLLVDPTTGRFHCIRCGTSCDQSKVQWRYRLVLSVADGTSIGRVVVFGRTLDGFFGKTATDFNQSLVDLEQTGYPASSMLAEALLRTFHGKYFYLGFKLTGSNDVEESPTLKHVLKSDTSLFNSQLDCTSNFDNSHTLAYQMLACSDAVYATVTDHMRLLVRHLRNQNQSKEAITPGSNQSYKLLKETDLGKSCRYSQSRFRGSISSCKTVSFSGDQESVRFSFERSTNESSTVLETNSRAGNRSSELLSNPPVVKDQSHDLEPLCVFHEQDSKSKESFLAATEMNTKNWPSYVTFDTFTEDGESCFPSEETVSKLICPPLDSHISVDCNSRRKDYTVASFLSAAGFHGNTFSPMSIAHKFDFENPNESDLSNTSKRIDSELKRREIVSSSKNVSCKAVKHLRPLYVTSKAYRRHENMKETNISAAAIVAEDFKETSDGIYSLDEDVNINSISNENKAKEKDTLRDTDMQTNYKDVISDVRMPESEDLDAFFESQFDGIEFTQEVLSIESSTNEKKNDEYVLKQHENANTGINKEIYTEECDEKRKLDAAEAKKTRNSLGSENLRVSEADDRNTEDLAEMNNEFQYLPESEAIEDFLDSFEGCFLEYEETNEKCPEVVSRASATEDIKFAVHKINIPDECLEVETETKCVKCFGTGEIARTAEYIAVSDEQKVDFMIMKDNSLKYETKMGKLDTMVETTDEFVIDRRADVYEEEEFFSTLSFVEDSHKKDGCNFNEAGENDENENINKYHISLGESWNCDNTVDSVWAVENICTVSKKADFNCVNAAESESEHENELCDLEEFFADISNFEGHSQEYQTQSIKQLDLAAQHESDIAEGSNVVIDRNDKNTNTVKTRENKTEIQEFFNELAQISLEGAENNAYKEISVVKYESAKYHCQDENEVCMNDLTENRIQTQNDTNQFEENNSIINNTPDFEQANPKVHARRLNKVFTLVPFFRKIESENELHSVVKSVLSLKSEASTFDKDKSGTSVGKIGVSGSFAEKKKVIEKTPETVNGCKHLKDSSFINYSADLFETSGAQIEPNSEYILTVCTPSFTTTSGPDSSNVSDVLFEDSPLGTSTPGLDECVILDSQDASSFVNTEIPNFFINTNDGNRKVKFDKRLRRVSSCHVMDIRMKLNESPLTAMPQVALKSCLKPFKEPHLNKAAECLEAPERTNTRQKPTASVSGKLILENENRCIHTNNSFSGIISNAEQKTDFLDGSSDLFGESFIAPAKETYSSILHEFEIVGQKLDISRAQVAREDNTSKVKEEEKTNKEEGGKLESDVFNIDDLWLNESSDSLVFEAVSDEIQDEHGLDKQTPHTGTTNNLKVNLIEEKSETPDLFISQESFDVFPLDIRKSNGPSLSKCYELPENQRNKYKPCQGPEKVWKGSSRQALKLLVMNTPDCDSDILSKRRTALLKSQNQSCQAEKNHGSAHEMKENISDCDSPDIFGDSVDELNGKFVCDKNNVVKKSSVLCKKLLF